MVYIMGKGLDLGAEPPRIKFRWVPLSGRSYVDLHRLTKNKTNEQTKKKLDAPTSIKEQKFLTPKIRLFPYR